MQQKRKQVQYFPVSELSSDITKRFFALFQVKERWTLEEIVPFLNDVAPSKKEKEFLLFKFARVSREDKTMYYKSRIK